MTLEQISRLLLSGSETQARAFDTHFIHQAHPVHRNCQEIVLLHYFLLNLISFAESRQ
jgi:hypothetical protein